MSSTTTSIFTFDHGQKKFNNAIGVSESYLEDLATQCTDVIKNSIFDENRNVREDFSPSNFVENCLHEFSYSQLVILASYYLQDRLNGFEEYMEKKLNGVVKKISLDEEEIPEHIKDFLFNLSELGKGISKSTAVDGEDLPKEIKDFLDNLVRKQMEDEDNDD